MRRFMTAMAGVTAFGAMVATAKAENLQGAPVRNGNQCFKYSTGADAKNGRFGNWSACPQAASTNTAATPRARRSRAALRAPSQRMTRSPFVRGMRWTF
jgi:hypothetical protein